MVAEASAFVAALQANLRRGSEQEPRIGNAGPGTAHGNALGTGYIVVDISSPVGQGLEVCAVVGSQ